LGSTRRRDIYLTTHIYNIQTPIPPAGFEPAIPASEPPQTQAADREITENGLQYSKFPKWLLIYCIFSPESKKYIFTPTVTNSTLTHAEDKIYV